MQHMTLTAQQTQEGHVVMQAADLQTLLDALNNTISKESPLETMVSSPSPHSPSSHGGQARSAGRNGQPSVDGMSQDGESQDGDPSQEDIEKERRAMMEALHPTGGKRAKTKKAGKDKQARRR